jgi:hypothetical protein
MMWSWSGVFKFKLRRSIRLFADWVGLDYGQLLIDWTGPAVLDRYAGTTSVVGITLSKVTRAHSTMFSFKEYHQQTLTRFRVVSLVSFVMHLTAFILLVLVGLSMPIIKSICLVRLQADVRNEPATSIVTELRFGVWGVCASR